MIESSAVREVDLEAQNSFTHAGCAKAGCAGALAVPLLDLSAWLLWLLTAWGRIPTRSAPTSKFQYLDARSSETALCYLHRILLVDRSSRSSSDSRVREMNSTFPRCSTSGPKDRWGGSWGILGKHNYGRNPSLSYHHFFSSKSVMQF